MMQFRIIVAVAKALGQYREKNDERNFGLQENTVDSGLNHLQTCQKGGAEVGEEESWVGYCELYVSGVNWPAHAAFLE